MPLEYEHLEFYKTIKRKAKFGANFSSPSNITIKNKQNREEHYNNLNSKISHLERYYNAYFADKKTRNLNSKKPVAIPILLQIDPASNIFDDLYKYGLEFICEDEDGFVLVATDLDGLDIFKEKLNKFKSYNEKENRGSGKIAEIHAIDNDMLPNKRLSPLLQSMYPFEEHRKYTVDISIDCKGFKPVHITSQRKFETQTQYMKRVEEARNNKYAQWDEFLDKRADSFTEFLSDYDSSEYEILDQTTSDYTITNCIPESIDFRVRLNGKILTDITQNYPFVFEISEPDDIECTTGISDNTNDDNALNIFKPKETDPVVCIIDSGIQEGHKYLKDAILSDYSVNYTNDTSLYDEVNEGGHGTRVAGRVLYPESIPTSGEYNLPCWLISSKVLDKDCKIPENKIPASIYENIIETNKNISKIYNSSINSLICFKRKHMSSWAAQIDNNMYKNDVLIIQSTGNINISYGENFPSVGIQKHFRNGNIYPEYLYNSISSKIANPAQSLFALTVGSVSENIFDNKELGIKSIEDKVNAISSFSRSGFGIWDSIKPEVVESGGGLIIDNSSNIRKSIATSINLIRRSPEGPAFAKDDVGTSYSTPVVANLAALLEKEFPNSTSLLYKTLIVHSAEWPTWANCEEMNNEQILNMLKSYGYGIPNKNKALQNDPHRITFITNGSMTINSQDARIHYIPIPESIRNPEYDKEIKITVTLCYTAKPRRTRLYKRGYLSTWLDWISIKKEEKTDAFEARVFDKEKNDTKNFKWFIDNNPEWGQVKGIQRSNSATQKDWTYIKSYELGEFFAIAVRSHKGWDNDPFSVANYSLAVTIEAVNNDLPIYNDIFNAVRAEIETINQIENEINI